MRLRTCDICLTSECISRGEYIMCCTTNLQLYADNGRLGLRGALLLVSMELLVVVGGASHRCVAIVDDMIERCN